MQEQAPVAVTRTDNVYDSPRVRYYFLGVMTLTYALNLFDRQLLSMLQESIKRELLLSDTQLGLLTGTAFAFFYVTAGVWIARWADRGNRRNIISIAVGLWSLMTALSGLAANYAQLFLARMGVGLGEAGGSPPAHSMISDVFPPEKRATAMATYSVGVNIGIMAGFLFGGILNEYFGWRTAFLAVGIPGVLLALLIRLTIKEPIRGWSENRAVSSESIPLGTVFTELWRQPAFRHISLAGGLTALVGYGTMNWSAPFFIRQHGLGTAELGVWLAMGSGVCGGIGTFAAGYFCDRLSTTDRRWNMWLPGITAVISALCMVFILTRESPYVALTANLLMGALITCYIGPTIATLHSIVDPRMRAMVSALFYLIINVIGLGIGPTLIGGISDALTPSYGAEALKHAMVIVIPAAAIWSALHYVLAARHTDKRLQADTAAV
jgi:predicted MFS family arabinose efflux permease